MTTAGRPSSSSRAGPVVVDLEVGDEHTVDPAFLDQPAVGGVVVVLGHLQQQRVSAGRQTRSPDRR